MFSQAMYNKKQAWFDCINDCVPSNMSGENNRNADDETLQI